MGLSASPFSFKDQLAFYGAYHANKVNVAIHIVCVPLIFMSLETLLITSGWSLAGISASLPPVLQAPVQRFELLLAQHVPPALYAHLNPGSLLAAVYLAYYYVLDVATAALFTPLWIAYYYASYALAEHVPNGRLIAWGFFAFSWVAQFYGHGVHEGRAPALMDNLLGALVLAPLFVFVEVLFEFGYRPELHKWLKNAVGKQVLEFRHEQKHRKETGKDTAKAL
ncbi:hypothetical protein MSPP1_000146 [Malassezia sp. CBS 17886]|nr:hypothetical protein MSPP1_000146 [Malassezia sp. CBS 17886]